MFFNTSGLQREGNGAEISPQITTAISIATLSSFSLGGKKHPEEGYGHPNKTTPNRALWQKNDG